jgi:hypothetical protein
MRVAHEQTSCAALGAPARQFPRPTTPAFGNLAQLMPVAADCTSDSFAYGQPIEYAATSKSPDRTRIARSFRRIRPSSSVERSISWRNARRVLRDIRAGNRLGCRCLRGANRDEPLSDGIAGGSKPRVHDLWSTARPTRGLHTRPDRSNPLHSRWAVSCDSPERRSSEP